MCPGARAPCRATSATSVNGLRPSAGSAARWRRSCGTWNDFLPARKETDMTKRLLPVCLVASFALVAAARSPGAQNPSSTSTRWFKGNTHTHTVNSDGDSTPEEVVRWYREHGYNFLVLTDHNYLTAVDGLTAVQENVDGIRRANGVPHINHPNFTWAMTTDDLMQVQRYRLFEIYNGHPQ